MNDGLNSYMKLILIQQINDKKLLIVVRSVIDSLLIIQSGVSKEYTKMLLLSLSVLFICRY